MNPTADSTIPKEGAVEVRLLRESDLAAALWLERQEHWNQTESDWRRLLRFEPHGCFAACLDGRVIGTVTTATYGTALAWIGMMLVDRDHRRRGIGTRLMRAALDYLQRAGVTTIQLDATPAGRPVYEALSFTPQTVIERWEGIAQPASMKELKLLDERTRPAVHLLDRRAFGADRTKLLDSLMTDSDVAPLIVTAPPDGQLRGYALARRGSNAFYVGPVVSTEGATAAALLDGMLSQLAGEKVYLDFHTGFGVGSNVLAERRFTKQRDLMRMLYGKQSSAGTPSLVFAIAGPEIG